MPDGGDLRRTPGLRRDEVALLAGVSLDYYTRLEQGKQCRPSEQVLDALAQVFHLDREATEHLHHLARARPGDRGIDGEDTQVDPYVLRLMNEWDHGLANVLNRRTDVLARNWLSAALAEGFTHTDNFMRMLFLSPQARTYWPEWEQEACSMVAHLRAVMGADHDDPSLLQLVEEVSAGSEDFRRMWARHDVRFRRHDVVRLRHRLVGEVTLRIEMFSVDSAPGQRLCTLQAAPGSPSEEALAKVSAMRPREPAFR
ncbi:helix-turn-helix transcriptional regulator [Planotetraspora phitsanulokensis]|uniref:Transcriptional regulator n=1 Tax=Planotetraspora phitsanulokensis TaxID=575192 RepID=A0A8J3U178_9ACTN|nr:transcriptional regulator [Planotetraspora phitsanulokensis]